MKGRLLPPLFVSLVVAVCTGVATTYWLAGGREFDRAVREWLTAPQQPPAKPTTPRKPPPKRPSPPPKPDPGAEAAVRAQEEAVAALRDASGAVDEARSAASAWSREVEPVLENHDGHLVAANPDLVREFLRVYRSMPGATIVPALEGRLAPYVTATDLVPHRQALVQLRQDAAAVRNRYRKGIEDALIIVYVARVRGAWYPITLRTALYSLETGTGVGRGGPGPLATVLRSATASASGSAAAHPSPCRAALRRAPLPAPQTEPLAAGQQRVAAKEQAATRQAARSARPRTCPAGDTG